MPGQQTRKPRTRRKVAGDRALHVAVIGDMVHSRALPASRRALVQNEFTRLMKTLNRLYRPHLSAKFVITLGDEFQGLLRTPEIIPRLTWTLERLFTARELRLGFGLGAIHTSIKEYAINVDGPALHNARASIELAKSRKLLGGVFTGFGPTLDPALNGFARILRQQRATWPKRQREVVMLLHEGRKRNDIAQGLGVTKQAVSRYALLAGWNAYCAAEEGWTALLRAAIDGVGV